MPLEDPLISIIMPTYNRADYIEATIKSIASQTYPHWELFVMDDGSTDNTKQVVEQIIQTDSRILYFPEQHTGITGILKNKAIEMAKGPLIAFMDSDDLWHQLKLEQQLKAMSDHPEAAFSFTNGSNFRDKTGEIEAYFHERKDGVACGYFFEEVCSGETGVRLPTLMVWKQFLTADNPFSTNRPFTDFSFIANLAQQYKAVILYDLLFKRREHDNNVTSTGWEMDYEEHLETIEKYKQDQKLNIGVANRILQRVTMNCGEEFLKRHKGTEARKLFLKSWLYQPANIIPLKKYLRSFL